MADSKSATGPRNPGSGAPRPTRREFLEASTISLAASQSAGAAPESTGPKNILLIIADQFRWDFVGAYGLNPMDVTPNIDSIGRRGVAFQNAVTNQPWCSPSRACLFTGQYATTHGVWRLGPGLRPDSTTLATVLRGHGYSTNYIGKWHLAPNNDEPKEGLGFVPPEFRGGFLDLWEAANVIELVSHPYEGAIWNAQGDVLHYNGVYRVDYLTQRAGRFLSQAHDKPFLLVVSYLEPHEQNDWERPVPPKQYEGKYINPFVPQDLRQFPGMWQQLLPDYYGAIKGVDDAVGVLLKTLADQHLSDNTIVVMLSDHANHFLTRTYEEWKCTPHESSIHIPLLIQGPGFDYGRLVPEIVSIVDIAPTLLDAVGAAVPDSMQGRSFMPVLRSQEGRKAWRQEAFIQFSASAVGRALRTPEWTYCVIDPNRSGNTSPNSGIYQEYQLYNLASDPHQLVNCVGRRQSGNWEDYSTRADASRLLERLRERMVEAGEGNPVVTQIMGKQVTVPGQPNPRITPPPYGLYS
jgi:arylsulfatase A-like enzyme